MDILSKSYDVLQEVTAAVSRLRHQADPVEARQIREILETMLRELPKEVLPNVVQVVARGPQFPEGTFELEDREEHETRHDGGSMRTSRLFLALGAVLPHALPGRVTVLAQAIRQAAREEAEDAIRRHLVARTLPAQVRPEVAGPDGDGDE